MDFIKRNGKKIGAAIGGGFVTLLGLVLIPYPGPGWLIVFAGLAILATEFKFAARALKWLKGKYNAWKKWLKRQPLIMQILILLLTGIFIIVSIWLLNTFGLIDNLFSFHKEWLHSPILNK